MIQWILRKIIGTQNQRELKRIWPIVRKINQIEPGLQGQPETPCAKKPSAGRRNWRGSTTRKLARRLEEILPEAFAVVKNAAAGSCGQEIIVRGQPLKWEMVHFDVQLIGGMALHRGTDRGNGHRRRQDAGRHAAGFISTRSPGAACTSSR